MEIRTGCDIDLLIQSPCSALAGEHADDCRRAAVGAGKREEACSLELMV